MKKFLFMMLISMSAQAGDVVPLMELKNSYGDRVQLTNDTAWCQEPAKAAIWIYKDGTKENGCWVIDSSGEVITIEWPNRINHLPRRKFQSLEV